MIHDVRKVDGEKTHAGDIKLWKRSTIHVTYSSDSVNPTTVWRSSFSSRSSKTLQYGLSD